MGGAAPGGFLVLPWPGGGSSSDPETEPGPGPGPGPGLEEEGRGGLLLRAGALLGVALICKTLPLVPDQ